MTSDNGKLRQPPRVISHYSRAQALADGVLVDVTEKAKEAGFQFPVAVTRDVWAQVIEPPERARRIGQSVDGRLWDVLWMLRVAIKRSRGGTRLRYQVIVQDGPGNRGRQVHTLESVCGPGDAGEPVITIQWPGED